MRFCMTINPTGNTNIDIHLLELLIVPVDLASDKAIRCSDTSGAAAGIKVTWQMYDQIVNSKVSSSDNNKTVLTESGTFLVSAEKSRIGALDCASGSQKSQTLNLNFASTVGTPCAFGADENLDTKGYGTRAVRAQSITIDLTGKKICSISLNSQNKWWKYDDFMFLTFDRYILASGQFTKNDFLNMGMATAGDLIIYEKAKHMGKGPYSEAMNSYRSKTCPNPGSCVTPISDTWGQFAIDVPDEWFKNLPDIEKSRQIHQLELWITGQGHSTDCQHTGINFTGTITYVE
jgi:hypothetical protein